MPIVSGSVLFNSNNTAPATGTAINNIPITLRNNSTGFGLTVLSNASGAFSFNNVPAGTYTLVESFGRTDGVATPGNFSLAAAIAPPTPADPPLSAVPSPPAGTTGVQSLSRNTINLTVAAADLTGQNFVDGPYTDIPLTALDTTLIGGNLVSAMAGGIYGTLPAGSANGTRVGANSAYPNNIPIGGTTNPVVTNIFNLTGTPGFLTTADHTSRDETGRMFQFDATVFGTLIFTTTVPLSPNTYYLSSAWIMNFDNSNVFPNTDPPKVGVRVLTLGGATIFDYQLANAVQGNQPIWNETATLFNSGPNTVVTYQLYSAGPASNNGNDYYLDDISLTQASVATIMTSSKTVDKPFAAVGDTINYTVVLRNNGQSTATNILFSDTIPTGTTFNPNSLRVNGVQLAGRDPSPPGFTLTTPVSSLASGRVITITFSTTVNTIPNPNVANNSATTSYFILPLVGGATVPQAIISNNVATTINSISLSNYKVRDMGFVTLGDVITYTIPITVLGNTTANNVVFLDTIPNGTTLVSDSLFVNGNQQIGGSPNPPGFSLGSISPNTTTTVSFKVLVTTVPTPNPIVNSGNVSYRFTVDPVTPDIRTAGTNTNQVSSQFNIVFLSQTKQVNKAYANIGDILTYTIPILNTGNVTAFSIVFIDTIPDSTSLVAGSLKQDGVVVSGSSNPPGVTLPNSLRPSGVTTITYQVRVNTIPNPNPIVNTASSVASFVIDPSVTPNRLNTTGANTNSVNTQINNASLSGAVKYVDKAFADCGDTINYTIVIPNTGNVAAQNVIFRDTIPNGTVLLPTTVFVNGVQQLGANPSSGVTIPNIAPGTTATVTFSVKVQC